MAYENEGKCGKCRLCWSKEVPIVAYIGHGVHGETTKVIDRNFTNCIGGIVNDS